MAMTITFYEIAETPKFTTKAPSHKEKQRKPLFIKEFFLVSSYLGGERSLFARPSPLQGIAYRIYQF
jgi:hypothetical protein